MVDIGTPDKVTSLWPTPPSRSTEKSGFKDKPPQQKQQKKKPKNKNEDGPGKTIDEYA